MAGACFSGGGRGLPVRRTGHGLAALAALLGALVGLPAALVVLGGNPLPRRWSGPTLLEALLRPDDGTVLIGLVTLVGWLAWAAFAVSVVVELVNVVGRRRVPLVVPGLAGVQRWAAALVLAVIALGAAQQFGSLLAPGHSTSVRLGPVQPDPARAGTPTPAGPKELSADATPAEPTPPEPTPPEPTPGLPDAVPADELPRGGPHGGWSGRRDPATTAPPVAAPGGQGSHVHVVRAGDDLWSLAERYYGQGRDWRRIAAANPAVLTGGPDRLLVGWHLVVPGVAGPDPADTGKEQAGDDQVRVRPGDTLTAVAERELGDGGRWREVYQANRAQLSDPDELPVGITLAVPRAEREPKVVRPPAARSSTARPATAPPPASPPERHQHDGDVRSAAPAAPSTTTISPAEDTPTDDAHDTQATSPAGLAAVGGLLAAGLLGGLALRRRVQLQSRPVGRRITHPPAARRPAEVALGHQARPLSLRTLDRATRAVAAHCSTAGLPLPALQLAYVSDDALELSLAEAAGCAPPCFTVEGPSWHLDQKDARDLSAVPGFSDAGRPWPTLVTLGRDENGRQVLADLEALGLLALTGPDEQASAVLAALAVELSLRPWGEDVTLTLVGHDSRLPDALGLHNVTRCDDVDGLLDRLERRLREQQEQAPARVLGQHRLDVNRADAWIPEIVLVDQALPAAQRNRLATLVTAEPRGTVAAVVRGAAGAPWTLELDAVGQALLLPDGLRLTAQALPGPGLDAVVDLVAGTGSTATTPAPWWPAQEEDPPERARDNVTYLGRRFGGTDDDEGRAAVQARMAGTRGGAVRHPTLQLLGPVELLGAAGPPPPRAAKQCLEYCAWLLENPGTTAQAMAAALVVAEGTRRSNMSRLRSWLGADEDGQPYLPDAYTGRIRLDACVSSDWQQLQVLTVAGVNRASSGALELALELVRGAPLADAAPGQWHWAEELRTDMISCVRDVGVELAGRALAAGDVDLARWAAARALAAAPGDELLLAARVRTEHLAGNVAETERLSLQLAAQARALGVDLDPTTVTLLQEVMEGRIRARMA